MIAGFAVKRLGWRCEHLLFKTVSVALLIAVAVLCVYWPVGSFEFVYLDDGDYVTQNPMVRQGLTWQGIGWAFRSVGWAANWHPVAWLSHMLDVSLFGVNAGAHHRINAAIHAVNAVMLLTALTLFTGVVRPSAAAALFFAVHPLHVESVAWISERKDLLAGFFWAATLLAYLWHTRRPSYGRFTVTAGMFALALMSKPMAVTLPIILLVLDFWPLGRLLNPVVTAGFARPRRLLAEKAILLAMSVGAAFLTILAQSKKEAINMMEGVHLMLRLSNALHSYASYLIKTFWPSELAVFYPISVVPPWRSALALVILAVVWAAVLRGWKKRPYLMAGWLWYSISLVPVAGLIQVGGQAMADRYTYLPLTGIFLMGAWLIFSPPGKRKYPAVVTALIMAVVALLSVAAGLQTGHWRDDFALFGRAAAVTGSAENFNSLGQAYYQRGRNAEAETHFREALRRAPNDYQAHVNLGNVLDDTGRWSEALSSYQRSLAINPGNPVAYVNIGVLLFKRGRYDEAAAAYRRAIEFKSEYDTAWYQLGMTLEKLGMRNDAVASYKRALAINPWHDQARMRLTALGAVGGRFHRSK